MGFYSKHILPNLINIASKQVPFTKQREKIIPLQQEMCWNWRKTGLNLLFITAKTLPNFTAIDPYEEKHGKKNNRHP